MQFIQALISRKNRHAIQTIPIMLMVAFELTQLGCTKKLKVGDTAPLLEIQQVIKGSSVHSFEKGQAYVLIFWATWCDPCKVAFSMPSIAKLKSEFDEVTFLAISDEPFETINAFIKHPTWFERLDFNVVTDPDKSTYNDYIRATKKGVPTAFIVGKTGELEWYGHPLFLNKSILKSVIDGSWNRQNFVDQLKIDDMANHALNNNDNDEYLKQLKRLAAFTNDDFAFARYSAESKRSKDVDVYKKAAMAQVTAHWNDATWLYGNGRLIIFDNILKKREIELSLQMLNRANQLTTESNEYVLVALAEAHHVAGNAQQAIVLLKQAIAQAPNSDNFEARLSKYQSSL